MKKLYLFAGMFSIAFLGYGQTRPGLQGAKFVAPKAPQGQISLGAHNNSGARLTTLFSEDFAAALPAGWAVVDSTSPSSGVNWFWTNVGHTGSYPTADILSPTAANGWMIVDSDLSGSVGTPEHTTLVSEAYNCTGQPAVAIQFYQMMREFQLDFTTVAVSGDGGTTWTYYPINDGIGQAGTPNPDLVFINVSGVAGNSNNVKVKWSWRGEWDYGWQIDDFSLVVPPADEIKINVPDYGSATLSTIWGENIRYTSYPVTQLDDVMFSAVLGNIGANNQTGVGIDVDVVNGVSTNIYSGSSAVQNLNSNELDTLYTTTNLTLPATPDNLSIRYALDYANIATDDDLSNNKDTLNTLRVTQYTYASDRNAYSGNGLYGGANGANDYAYIFGNQYQIFNTATAQGIQVAFSASTVVGTQVYPMIYEMDPAAADFQSLLGIVVFDGSGSLYEKTITSQMLSSTNNMVIVDFDLPQGLTLNAGSEYVVAIGTYGGPATTSRVVIMNGEMDHPNKAHTFTYTTGQSGTQWFYSESTPVIRLSFDGSIGTGEIEANNFSVGQNYPNPTDGTTAIELSLNESSDVMFEVTDLTGKVVYTHNYGKLGAGSQRITFDGANLAAGTYMYSFTVGGEKVSKLLIITE